MRFTLTRSVSSKPFTLTTLITISEKCHSVFGGCITRLNFLIQLGARDFRCERACVFTYSNVSCLCPPMSQKGRCYCQCLPTSVDGAKDIDSSAFHYT